MWTPIAFIVILAACATAEHGFKTGTEYKYEVTSKTLTSLQQVSDQYSGVVMRAQLTLTPMKDDELIAYITQPETSKVHTTLRRGVEQEIPQEGLQFTPLALSKEPFVIKMKEGVVDELIVSKELPVWEVNIIRSIVSQFQIDTQGRRLIPSKINTVPHGEENTGVYKIMEDTVEGECEVLYDVTPLPKYILQTMPSLAPTYHLGDKEELIDIMKTKNFTNCEQRPGYHFGFTGLTNWKPTTNKMGNFLSRSSVSRVVLSGNLKTYTIQSSVTTNKVILSPEIYNSQKGEVVSRMNLTLVSVQAGSQNVQGPQNPQTLKKLVYDFNGPFTTDSQVRDKWDQRQEQDLIKTTGTTEAGVFPEQMRSTRSIDERTLVLANDGWYQSKPQMSQAPETPFLPRFVGYSGHSIQHSKEVNVNQIVRKMAEQIGQTLQDQTHLTKESTLEKFTILTKVLRTMNVKQLEQTVQELYTPEKEGTPEVTGTARNAWMVFRDALAQAGTGPALMTISTLITTQKLKGEEAAQLVSVLTETARYPTTEYMNTFFELVKNPEVVSQARLNTSAIYAFTKLVRLAQVNQKTLHNRYPVHTFGYLTRQEENTVVETYIPYFAQQLEHAIKQGDSHKIQIYVKALGNIGHPKIVQVFEPYLEGKEPMSDFQRTLVVVSLSKLTEVHPKLARSVLYKIYANTGEVYQVRVAALYNLMKTNPPANMLQRMAQFTHEDPSNQVRSAVKSAIESAALLTTKDNSELRQNALSAVNMLIPKVYGLQYSRLNLTDYLVKGLHLGYTETFKYIGSEDSLIPKTFLYKVLGNINGYKATLFKASAMVSSVQTIYEFLEDTFALEEQEQTAEGTPQGDVFTVEKITKILNMEHPMKEQVEGNFAFRFGTLQRFFAFDNHTIESLPEIVNKYLQLLSQGKVYNYQKFFSNYEVTIGLPTATGLPFVYTLDTPIYVGLKGKVQAELPEVKTSLKGYKVPQTATVSTNVEITYAANKQGEISFVTPYDHQRYVAGYKKQTHLNLPVKGSLNIDVPKRYLQLEIKPVDKHGDYRLIHYSTIPYTAVVDVVDVKPITQGTNTKVMEPKTLKKVSDHIGGKLLGMTLRLEAKTGKRNVDLKKLVYDMLERHDITSGTFYPTVETSIDSTHVDLFVDSKLSTIEGLGLTATYRKISPKEIQQETDTKKAFVPTPDAQTRVKQFYEQTSAGIKGATVHVLDLGLKVQGSKPLHYVGTVATARSPIDPNTKVLAYLHKSGSENYEICYEQLVKDTYVTPFDYEKAIETEAHSEITAQLKFGDKCESGAKVTLNGKLERTQERRQYVQTLPQVQKCKTEMQQGTKYSSNCRNATLQAGLMDKYRFTVKYDKVPETVKNITYHTYSFLRHFGYPYVTESLTFGGNAQQGQVELDVNFSPDLKSTNIYVSAPTGVAEFRDVHIGKYARTLAVVHPVTDVLERLGWTTLRQQYDAYCTIDKVQTKTFDNQTYTATLGNTWHVMTVSIPKINTERKDQTFKEFSVLVREGASNTKEVQFTFNYAKGPVVTIVPSQGKPHGTVTVNGQPVHFDEKGFYEHKTQTGKVIFQIYVLPTQELKFVATEYGFEFLYDQTRVQLALSHTYRNRVGGLCGVYNGEQFNYVTPERYILKSPEEFAATWALTSEGHIAELKKKAHEHSVYKKTTHYTTVIGSQDTKNYEVVDTEEYDSNSSGESLGHKCTTKRIMVIERDGKHCFSVHPQTACKAGCQVEKTRTMNAEFICVNKTQTSSHWAQMVARGAQPNFRNKGNAQKIQFEAPEVCTE